MITARQAKEIYDKETRLKDDYAVHVRDAGDFFVIEPNTKSLLGITIVSKEGAITRRNRYSEETMKKIFSSKLVF